MELLRDYGRHGSETAFAELVHRHIHLVYSAAFRRVGVAAQAEEITQAVFIILARKAAALRPDVVLEGWLHETTRLTALRFLRGERRRQFHEKEASMQSSLHESSSDSVWNQLAPLLDDGLSRLGKTDRDAVILRFFKDKSVREIASKLKVSEAAAQRRVLRALEKLRKFFAKRGVVSTAAVIGAAISANSVQAAPAGLAVATVAAAKSSTVALSTLALVKGTLKLMTWLKVKSVALGLGAAAVLAGSAATVLLPAGHAQSLPHVDPATGLPVASAGSRSDTINPANGLPDKSVASDNPVSPGLPPTQSAADLLATSGDPFKLLALATKFSNDARYEEALQCYLKFHSQIHESTTNGVLEGALPGWAQLGEKYPRARQALIDIRDQHTRQFVEGHGYSGLFQELADINNTLHEQDATYALFKGIEHSDPSLAQQCYWFIQPVLVQRGDYESCLPYLGDLQVKFNILRQTYDLGQSTAERMAESRKKEDEQLANGPRPPQSRTLLKPQLPPAPGAPVLTDTTGMMKNASQDIFVNQICQLIEILVGTENQADAENIRDQALAVVKDPRLQSAVEDAAARVRTFGGVPQPAPPPLAVAPPVSTNSSLFNKKVTTETSVETWAPELEFGQKPDLLKIQQEAKELANKGDYEAALQRHLWYHNHALEYDPEGQRGVRLSFALADWVELGRRYPKARQALLEIRDLAAWQFAQGAGSASLFHDITAINKQLSDDDRTCKLFDFIRDQNPGLAKRCYPYAEIALLQKGDYALCFSYLGDYQARFEKIRQQRQNLSSSLGHTAEVLQQAQKKRDEFWAQKGQKPPMMIPLNPPSNAADDIFVGETSRLIEILAGTGHKVEAEQVRTQALALVDDPRLKSTTLPAEIHAEK